MRRLFRFTTRLVRKILVGLVFAFAVLAAWLHFQGLPESWKQTVLHELALRGMDLEIESLHWDPLQGVVGHGVSYHLRHDPTCGVRMAEICLNVRLRDLLRRRPTLDRIQVDGSEIELRLAPNEPPLLIRHAAGGIRFAGAGVIELDDLVGDLAGLHLEFSGRLDMNVTPSAVPVDVNRRPWKIGELVARLGKVKSGKPIEIRLRMSGRPSEPKSLRMEGTLEGRQLAYETWRADRIQGHFSLANGMLDLSSLEIEAGGGHLSLGGDYDFEASMAHFELTSNLNPNALQPLAGGRHPTALADWSFAAAPEVWVKGGMNFSREGGWKTLEAEGSVWGHDFTWRGTHVREVCGNFQAKEGVIQSQNLMVQQDDGRLTGNAAFDLKNLGLTFDFNSTLDIAVAMRLLYPSEKNWFQHVRYTKPPLLRLAGRWMIRDPLGLSARGDIDWQDWFVNDVRIASTRAQVEIDGRRFHFQGMKLARDEGAADGDLVLDFQRQTATMDMTTAISFPELCRIISPKMEETFRPYRFVTPPTIRWKGTLTLQDDPRDNDLWTRLQCARFETWRLKASEVTAEVRYFRSSVEVARYASTLYGGRLEGNAIFDLSTPGGDWAFELRVDRVDFDSLTHDLWNYSEVQGVMTGWARMSGMLKSSRPLVGRGEVKVAEGVLWKIPLFGELSKFIPLLGVQKANKGTALFHVDGEKVMVDDMKVSAGIMSLTAKGNYKFDQSLDFIVQGHFLRGLFGVGYVLDPFTKAFEYHLGGTLAARKWKPRFIPKEMLFQFDGDQAPSKPKTEKP